MRRAASDQDRGGSSRAGRVKQPPMRIPALLGLWLGGTLVRHHDGIESTFEVSRTIQRPSRASWAPPRMASSAGRGNGTPGRI